jgi:Polyketide cyclase / dehydrase and lipid transport
MKSTIAIEIAAPAELVFRLARGVERWPDLLPHYVEAKRQRPPDERGRLLVRFAARRRLVPWLGLGVPVTWQAWTWSESDARRLRFLHRGGATDGMDVTWRIEERGSAGSHVEIEHVFRPRVPAWAAFVDRGFTRPIAGHTLRTFRAIAEAAAAAARTESEQAPSTNPPS